MGSRRPVGARPPSHVAYYVATAGVVGLLLLLCCYLLYFCVKRINELSEHESLTAPRSSSRPPPAPAPAPAPLYPVHTVVRDSASAMVKLCKEVPGGAAASVPPALAASASSVNQTPAAR